MILRSGTATSRRSRRSNDGKTVRFKGQVARLKKDRDGYTDNVYVELTEDAMRMYAQKEVVDEVITPATEVTLDAARKVDPHAQLGDLVNVEIKTQAFGRIAAQTAKQVIIQASARPSAA